MASNIKILDPVQGLIDYVNDIKPYHTKVIESLVEYVGQESVDVSIADYFGFEIGFDFFYDIGIIGCIDGGYGSLGFDDPELIPVLSPDPSKTMIEFPAMTSNTFVVLGDLTLVFDPTSNLVFNMFSYIEDRIIGVNASSGSPLTGGAFILNGDKSYMYNVGDIIGVSGSLFNDKAYRILNVTVGGSPLSTTLDVEGQVISNNVSGSVRTKDSNNNGTFTVVNSVFAPESRPIVSYTTVNITGINNPGSPSPVPIVPPVSGSVAGPGIIGPEQRYITLISVGALPYSRVLSYSNALKYYDPSSVPPTLLSTPDEGINIVPLVAASAGSPSYVTADGNFQSSNLFVGDNLDIINSSNNDGTYNISSINYDPVLDQTIFGVSPNLIDNSTDGNIKVNIPSNVIIIPGDYTDFFHQGIRIRVLTGSIAGVYTTMNSKFINGETHIRVEESIFRARGRQIISLGSPTLDGFVVEGNVIDKYKQNVKFNVINSVMNDGVYTVFNSGSPSGSVYDPITNTTFIPVLETYNLDTSDATGEIHLFAPGTLEYLTTGFGETPELCEAVPQTLVQVDIKDNLYIDNIGIWASDDIIAYGLTGETWGYDLPEYTIFYSGGSPLSSPPVTVSDTPPASPVEDMLWFDTSNNTGSPTGPGILKQYISGSPVIGWIEVPNSKAYWVDTDTNYMYYRTVYQYYDPAGSPNYYGPIIDTEWILEYTKIPGYNDHLTAVPTRELQGIETFFAIESPTGVAVSTYTLANETIPLTSGSPAVPNPKMIEVYVNSSIAEVNLLSTTEFEIITPRLRVSDFIEARVFDDTAIPSNTFVGAYDTNAAIEETFNMILGYKFNIVGTEVVSGSPTVYNIYISGATKSGSPPSSIFVPGKEIEIIDSEGSPNNDGTYTITAVNEVASPIEYTILTVNGPLLNTGIFSGSPVIESGKALYEQWFQYFIVNTTANTIVVSGDATDDIGTIAPFAPIKIVNSSGSPSNNGNYTVTATSYDGSRNTTITVVETISNVGNFGGWVESI